MLPKTADREPSRFAARCHTSRLCKFQRYLTAIRCGRGPPRSDRTVGRHWESLKKVSGQSMNVILVLGAASAQQMDKAVNGEL